MTITTPTQATNEATSRYFWDRPAAASSPGGPPFDPAKLAAIRRGVGRGPGSVPEVWPYYTTLRADGRISDRLVAEHIALTLFAVHQQSKTAPMHRDGVGLGTALRALRSDPKRRFSAEAIDRRFNAAATATSTGELASHLRSLIGLLRQHNKTGQPLDYGRLMKDLIAWQHPEQAARVRRTWGSQYFAPEKVPEADEATAQATESARVDEGSHRE